MGRHRYDTRVLHPNYDATYPTAPFLVLQAVEEMDAGDIWATRNFAVPDGPDGQGATKSWLYQSRVVSAAIEGLREAVAKFISGARRAR